MSDQSSIETRTCSDPSDGSAICFQVLIVPDKKDDEPVEWFAIRQLDRMVICKRRTRVQNLPRLVRMAMISSSSVRAASSEELALLRVHRMIDRQAPKALLCRASCVQALVDVVGSNVTKRLPAAGTLTETLTKPEPVVKPARQPKQQRASPVSRVRRSEQRADRASRANRRAASGPYMLSEEEAAGDSCLPWAHTSASATASSRSQPPPWAEAHGGCRYVRNLRHAAVYDSNGWLQTLPEQEADQLDTLALD